MTPKSLTVLSPADARWSEAYLFAQAVSDRPLRHPSPTESPCIEPGDCLRFVQAITGRPFAGPTTPLSQQEMEPGLREFLRDISPLHEGNWDPEKHPRGGFEHNRGWFSLSDGSDSQPSLGALGSTPAGDRDAVETPFVQVGFRKGTKKKQNETVPSTATAPGPQGITQPTPTKPSVNAEGIEVAGPGPHTTQSYKEKVQKALETLDPNVGRWWKANSIGGQLRSRDAGLSGSKSRGWVDQETPYVEVDRSFTPGQTAQAIIEQAKEGFSHSQWEFSTGNIESTRAATPKSSENGNKTRRPKLDAKRAFWRNFTSIRSRRSRRPAIWSSPSATWPITGRAGINFYRSCR